MEITLQPDEHIIIKDIYDRTRTVISFSSRHLVIETAVGSDPQVGNAQIIQVAQSDDKQ
jgi:hypothetical protein